VIDANPLAVDTETTGLRPFQGDKVTMASFADDSGSWALPPDGARCELQRAVEAGRRIILHNSPFDRAVFSANWGIEIPDEQVWDTLTVDWMLDENADHRLKEGLGVRLFGEDAKAEKEALKAMMRGRKVEEVYRELRDEENLRPRAERERATATRERAREIAAGTRKTWETLTFEDLKEYAEQDANLTWRSYWWQQGALDQDTFVLPDLEREHQLDGLAYRMTRRGIRVDAARAAMGMDKAENRVAELQEQFAGTNLKSPLQLQKLLYDEWRLPVMKETKTGGRSTDKDALEALSYDPRVQDLQEFRHLAKQVDAYYFPLLDRIGPDGRIHPAFRPHGTKTGRWSCSGPNLQTIPRESTAAELRKVFVPAKGLELTEWDLSQIEVRVMAEMSKEPTLLRVYEEEGDVYQALADEMGVDRASGKVLVLMTGYGAGPRKIAVQLAKGTGREPDVRRAGQMYRNYWATYPNLHRLMKGLEEVAKRRGFLALWKPGRRRVYRSPNVRFPKYFTALNSMVQGGAAELLKDVLLELDTAV
jgi:DNA polymerase I-like protein with 3'-5' exonuclease and polymerase domains